MTLAIGSLQMDIANHFRFKPYAFVNHQSSIVNLLSAHHLPHHTFDRRLFLFQIQHRQHCLQFLQQIRLTSAQLVCDLDADRPHRHSQTHIADIVESEVEQIDVDLLHLWQKHKGDVEPQTKLPLLSTIRQYLLHYLPTVWQKHTPLFLTQHLHHPHRMPRQTGIITTRDFPKRGDIRAAGENVADNRVDTAFMQRFDR